MNNEKIARNISFVPHDNNFKCKNEVILLIITDGKKWHYLAVKSLSALLRGITSNHNGDFYCLNCFHTCITKNRKKRHKRVCNDHEYCHVKMPNENNKILKYNHRKKSLKAPAIIYTDLECLLKKCILVKIILKNLTQRKKIYKHILSGYSLFTDCSFDATRNKLDCYKDEDCTERFCKDLRDHAMKIIN